MTPGDEVDPGKKPTQPSGMTWWERFALAGSALYIGCQMVSQKTFMGIVLGGAMLIAAWKVKPRRGQID